MKKLFLIFALVAVAGGAQAGGCEFSEQVTTVDSVSQATSAMYYRMKVARLCEFNETKNNIENFTSCFGGLRGEKNVNMIFTAGSRHYVIVAIPPKKGSTEQSWTIRQIRDSDINSAEQMFCSSGLLPT